MLSPRAVGVLIGHVALMAGCDCETTRPCLPWARLGQTYSVAIGDVVTPSPTYPDVVGPWPAYGDFARSCGTTFDIVSGDKVDVYADSRGKEEGPTCPSCFFINARVVGGVTSPNLQPTPFDKRTLYSQFEAPHVANFASGCRGDWTFGVTTVKSGDGGATRTMAYRLFTASGDGSPCLGAGSQFEASKPYCWDAWFARVLTPNGDVVTE